MWCNLYESQLTDIPGLRAPNKVLLRATKFNFSLDNTSDKVWKPKRLEYVEPFTVLSKVMMLKSLDCKADQIIRHLNTYFTVICNNCFLFKHRATVRMLSLCKLSFCDLWSYFITRFYVYAYAFISFFWSKVRFMKASPAIWKKKSNLSSSTRFKRLVSILRLEAVWEKVKP